MTAKVLWEIVREAASRAGIEKLAPHDLRRTCARLCRLPGGELDPIQFLLGHVSTQTTERYLGCKQQRPDRYPSRTRPNRPQQLRVGRRPLPIIVTNAWPMISSCVSRCNGLRRKSPRLRHLSRCNYLSAAHRPTRREPIKGPLGDKAAQLISELGPGI